MEYEQTYPIPKVGLNSVPAIRLRRKDRTMMTSRRGGTVPALFVMGVLPLPSYSQGIVTSTTPSTGETTGPAPTVSSALQPVAPSTGAPVSGLRLTAGSAGTLPSWCRPRANFLPLVLTPVRLTSCSPSSCRTDAGSPPSPMARDCEAEDAVDSSLGNNCTVTLPLSYRRAAVSPPCVNLSSGDLEGAAMKGWPLLFHQTHSDNIQLSLDRRRAKRYESFCKGICFSNRPIAINERVYLKFTEVSTSWSGVVRFGLTAHDPATINGSELPRYACPDLTNKPGHWAKAVPERFAEQSNTLFFYVTRNGDVMYGLNNEEKGLFFSGVNTSPTLWALVDIYGNSTSMEFVDGRQLNNLSPSSGVPADSSVSPEAMLEYASMRLNQPGALSPSGHSQSMPSLPAAGGAQGLLASSNLPVRFYNNVTFNPMPFHAVMGRNVCLSADKTLAVRLVEEYCNGYVFTERPLRCGERMVIQILSVDTAFVGGLAFGMTACDPAGLNPNEMPDDSDLLLDRPEYWVVNKDVCSVPEVGDELSFHLTEDGEVRYGKNGHHVTTLMHVDKTLPLWAFFDVYGSTQQIKSLGIVAGPLTTPHQHRGSVSSGGGLTVALPPPRAHSTSPSPSQSSTAAITPPPRPPPPRSSPSSRRVVTGSESPTPPSLPPKQFRPLPAPPPPPGTILQPTLALNAVPPALQLQTPPPPVAPRTLSFVSPTTSTPAPARPTVMPPSGSRTGVESDEAADNASNECSVCFEKAVDCVLYTCGHMCLCYECAVDIKSNQGALCPICRQVIRDIIKIYRS